MTTYDNQASAMPNTYDNNVNTVKQDDGLISVAYIKSLPGLLKAGEMVSIKKYTNILLKGGETVLCSFIIIE